MNTSEFTNKNEIPNYFDNISLWTNNLDNNKKNMSQNQNPFNDNDNILSQIKPADFASDLGIILIIIQLKKKILWDKNKILIKIMLKFILIIWII